MADVQVAVGLGRKAGDAAECLPLLRSSATISRMKSRRAFAFRRLGRGAAALGFRSCMGSPRARASVGFMRAQRLGGARSRRRQISLPSTAMVSNSGGVAARPVTATRTGMKSSLAGQPLASRKPERRLHDAPRSTRAADRAPARGASGGPSRRRPAVRPFGTSPASAAVVVRELADEEEPRVLEEVLQRVDALVAERQHLAQVLVGRAGRRAGARGARRVDSRRRYLPFSQVSFSRSKTGPPREIRSSSKAATNSSSVNSSRPSGIAQPISARKLSIASGR